MNTFHRPGQVFGYQSQHGSREEQLRQLFRSLRAEWSQAEHSTTQLYTLTEDCAHRNPEEDERFEGVDDLVEEWMDRNCAGLRPSDWNLYYKNRARAAACIPLVGEYDRAMSEWEDLHSGSVCLGTPQGTACAGCADMDSDFGVEEGGCELQTRAREAWDEFWALVEAR